MNKIAAYSQAISAVLYPEGYKDCSIHIRHVIMLRHLHRGAR